MSQIHEMGIQLSKVLIFAWNLKFIISRCRELFFLKWQAYLILLQENVSQTPKSE